MQKVEDFMENLTKHDAEIWNNAISEFIEKFNDNYLKESYKNPLSGANVYEVLKMTEEQLKR